MPYYSFHVEQVYDVEAADDQEAASLVEVWRTGGVPPNLVPDSRSVYVTDEMGEEVEA